MPTGTEGLKPGDIIHLVPPLHLLDDDELLDELSRPTEAVVVRSQSGVLCYVLTHNAELRRLRVGDSYGHSNDVVGPPITQDLCWKHTQAQALMQSVLDERRRLCGRLDMLGRFVMPS